MPFTMTPSLDDILAAFDPTKPLERAETIPASWYLRPDMYERERERVFGAHWIVAGRADQVTSPGGYFTQEIAGRPIAVVNGGDRVRAFYNVCRHRAAPLLTEPDGTVTKLRCRYHGWTYDLHGRLRGTPEFDGVKDFAREDNGLWEVALEGWGPLVGVHVGKPKVSLAEHLAPLAERLPEKLRDFEFVARKEYAVGCNWKVFVDNYLDGGYHINSVHPALGGMLDYSQYRTEVFDWTSLQSGPLTTADGQLRSGRAQYWYVFPNFMLNVSDGVMDTNLVLPVGPEACRVVFDFYFARGGPAADAKFREQSMALSHQIQLEDQGICEEVQRGLGSGVFDTGRFSVKREAAGYHFHQLLARCLRKQEHA